MERWDGAAHGRADDVVAAEEPLQVALDGEPFAVVMRTPGHDLELVLGLLFVEGLLKGVDDVAAAAVAASGVPETAPPFPVRELPEAENLVELRLRSPHLGDRPVGWQRNLVASSACGICGAAALDALREDLAPLPPGPTFRPDAITAMAPALRAAQDTFELAHKAVAAGVPLLAAVSAPSSLAVHVAHTFGLTLVGFLRGDHFNVYAGAERISTP